jgi:UDP-N-acetylglucosamine acyltransferase
MKHNEAILGRTVIGDENYIREHVTISASTIPTADEDHRVTSIGNRCWLMAYSHVGHDCHVGNNVIMANCASLAGHVEVEDYANLGGLVGVHQECVIGAFSFIGGMTRVSQDIPPYMLVEGNPARCRGVTGVGLRRRGFDDQGRARIKDMYRIMFRSDKNVTQALHEIERSVADSAERSAFVEFYRKSIRGVTR